MERVLKGVEAVGLLAQGREYELLKKHARWLDKLHSDCCGLRTHFRDALEIDVRQIIFTRELEEAASWFDEQTDPEVGETVRRLSQAAATLDQDILRWCPDLDASTLYIYRVHQIAHDYNKRKHTAVAKPAGSTGTADANSERLDRIISLMDELISSRRRS